MGYYATRVWGLYVPNLMVTQIQVWVWDVHVGYRGTFALG